MAEALGVGKPVLISNKVNVWREILADKAGFVCADNQDGVDKLLLDWVNVTEADRSRMVKHAQACFRSHFSIDAMATSLLDAVTDS